jgi:hypothetical protein
LANYCWETPCGTPVAIGASWDRLGEREADACRALARESPEEVVEIVRQNLGAGVYREVLREMINTPLRTALTFR